jgi:hypothetical protein
MNEQLINIHLDYLDSIAEEDTEPYTVSHRTTEEHVFCDTDVYSDFKILPCEQKVIDSIVQDAIHANRFDANLLYDAFSEVLLFKSHEMILREVNKVIYSDDRTKWDMPLEMEG